MKLLVTVLAIAAILMGAFGAILIRKDGALPRWYLWGLMATVVSLGVSVVIFGTTR